MSDTSRVHVIVFSIFFDFHLSSLKPAISLIGIDIYY